MDDDHMEPVEPRLSDAEAATPRRRTRAPEPEGLVPATPAELDDLVADHPVVIVEAWTPWSGPCRTFAPVYERTARKFDERALFLQIDVEEHPGLRRRYDIDTVPTMLAFRDGQLVYQRSGAMPRAMLEEYVRTILSDGSKDAHR